MIKDAQKAKAEKHLNSLVNYKGKIITLKEYLHTLKDEGFLPEANVYHDTTKEEKETERLRRIINSWDFPAGNPNHPMSKRYYQDKEELAKGIFKTVYMMSHGNLGYVITKTAYDYITEKK